jgi:predicted AlkP superfamily phosphohydrolase/phosphomutase
MRKVIVIGLDGLDPGVVEAMLAAGELPNLGRLRSEGGYARVATTTPAQTPVAWSTFATGVNPGGHGVFDFLRRDPGTYLPDLGLNRYESRGAFLPPRVVNLRRGVPMWDLLGAAGVGSTVLRCPVTYPPDPIRGRMLSGMGVPDLRGGFGTATFYTTDEAATAGEGEQVIRVRPGPGGRVVTHLPGPRAAPGRAEPRMEFTVEPDPARRRVTVHAPGAPGGLEVGEGRWSDWLPVKFKVGALQSVRGRVRFHLVRLAPALELYASPVNFDPEAPPFPISAPADYAAELTGALGPFHTTGMVEDHAGLMNGRLDEDAFLDQCDLAWQEREAMMLYELERGEPGLFFCLFDTPDRVQHLFWRFREPDHPANRGAPHRPELARVIEEQYRRGDDAVGKALEFADDETLVVALSDHGFGSFRRGVNLNTVLYELGLLALRDGARPGDEAGDMLRGVDWSRTRAYALGLGGVYLNLEGREREGTVGLDEIAGLKRSLAGALAGLIDAATGTAAVNRVRDRDAVYSGPFAGEAPDLLIDFAPGYRASWGTSLGGVPEGRFEDNTRRWAGDHIVDPREVPGVLFMNRPFRADGPALIDLAPTVLDALGVPKGPAMEGSTLLP